TQDARFFRLHRKALVTVMRIIGFVLDVRLNHRVTRVLRTFRKRYIPRSQLKMDTG
ncbi:hypothetical protein SARC_16764, partial [Sphaeroforma arctica JP610]